MEGKMSEFSMPMDLRVLFSCDLCGNNLEEKYYNLRVYLGNRTLKKLKVCDKCIEDKTHIPKESLDFFRILQEYKKFNNLTNYKQTWNKEAVEVLIKYLKSKKMEIKKNGIELFSEWKNGDRKGYDILDAIKLYKIKI